MREPRCKRQLRLLSATFAVILLVSISACGGGSKAVPVVAANSDSGRYSGPQPQTLTEALSMIRQEELAALKLKDGKQTLALPDTLQGDDEWFAGPTGGFTEDSIDHSMRLQSSGVNPDDPNNIAFAIYRMQNHALDLIEELSLGLTYTSGEYWVYVVDYSGTASWQQFGPFSAAPGGAGWPLDLSSISPISAADRVYVAVVAGGESDVTVESLTIQQSTPPPPDYFETEPNDTFEQANALPLFDFNLTDVVGHLGGSDVADWYSFEATTAGRVYLTLVLPETTGDLDLELYDTDGTAKLGASAGTEAAERIDFDIVTPGTYFVKALAFGGGAGDYQLWGTYADTGENVMFEIEANNAPQLANAVPPLPVPDPSIMGAAGPGDLHDYYTFQSFEQNVASITMYTDRDNPAQRLELIGTDGSTLITSDSIGGAFYQVKAVVQAGTYYIHVQQLSGSFDYELRAELSGFDPDNFFEIEPNNNPASANPFPAFNFPAYVVTGDVGDGGFYDGSADDWFTFDAAEEGSVKLMLSRSFGIGDPYLELFDSDGTTLLANSFTGYFPESITYYFAAAGGPYYLHVACSNFTWCTYGITGLFHPGVGSYFETEDNDSAAAANPLPAMPFSGNAVTANLGLDGDYDGDEADWYSFTVLSGGTIGLTMYIDSIGGDLDLELYDTDGLSLLDWSRQTVVIESIEYTLPAAGTYFVKALAWSSSKDASNYSLDASFQP